MVCISVVLSESQCSSGYYSLGSLVACIPCPGGYQCSDRTASPEICPAGSYASNTSDSCTECSAGYYCPTPGLTEPLQCPAGHYQDATNQTSCTICPRGNGTCLSGREAVLDVPSLLSLDQKFSLLFTGTYCLPGLLRRQKSLLEFLKLLFLSYYTQRSRSIV